MFTGGGRNLSQYFTESQFDIQENGTAVASGGNLSSVKTYSFYYEWGLKLTDFSIQAGDYIILNTNLGDYFNNVTIGNKIYSSDNVEIATATYDGTSIKIVFESNVQGIRFIDPAGTGYKTNGAVTTKVKDNALHSITVGSITKNYVFNNEDENGKSPASTISATKWATAVASYQTMDKRGGYSNTDPYNIIGSGMTVWYMNIPAVDEFVVEGSATDVSNPYKDSYMVDTLNSEQEISYINIHTLESFYRDDGSWMAINLPGRFSNVTQLAGETLADFQTRVTSKGLQYGIYTNSDNNETFIVSVSNAATTYSDIFGMSPYDYAKQSGLTENECKRFASMYAETGDGPIVAVALDIGIQKRNPVGYELITNTAIYILQLMECQFQILAIMLLMHLFLRIR